MPTIEQVRRIAYLGRLYGMKIPVQPVCRGHSSPGLIIARGIYDRPSLSLTHGPRGGGKSISESFKNFILGQMYPEYEAKILGGSQAQSEQIYRGMDFFRRNFPAGDPIEQMLATKAIFRSGAVVEMLTASEKSVRGPHVPQLCLDEVDEIVEEILDASFGMVVQKGRLRASISMASTWHRVGGPMSRRVKEGREGKFPVDTFCMFDVLERCPEERSGKHLEKCPECPLMPWCHSDRDEHPQSLPKAKRSCGHYAIDALIQKTMLSRRAFESDYLSLEPRAPGQWFTDFDESLHVTEEADYQPGRAFHVAIDGGVHTGAVLFQCVVSPDRTRAEVNVFGDYYAEHLAGGASAHAEKIMALTRDLTGNPTAYGTVSMDQACKQASAVGASVLGEYKRVGCIGKNYEITPWRPVGPGNPKNDTLALIEALLLSAGNRVSMRIHPRCEHLIAAFKAYVRKKTRDSQWLDEPADPQHPSEEMIDALAGGLGVEIPEGLAPQPPMRTITASKVLY